MTLGFIHQVSNFPVIEHLCHAPQLILLLILIIGLAGFVNGMAGFGFGLVGASVLWILPPREGVPLVMLLSACSQILSIFQLRSVMLPLRQWWPDGPALCILAGLAGVPAGLWLLAHLNSSVICTLIGLLIAGCSLWMIFRSKTIPANALKRTPKGDLTVGLIAGAVGGLCANPGPVMVIWSNLLGLSKDRQRALIQPFILVIQLTALFVFLIRGGVFSGCLGIIWGCSIVVIFIASNLGGRVFRMLSDSGYSRLVMILLIISGASMIAKGCGCVSDLFMKLDHFVLSI
jgi:uncharacterized membrane protein YfcA